MAQKPDKREEDWRVKYADVLGKIPDRELAELAGGRLLGREEATVAEGHPFWEAAAPALESGR